SRSSASPASSLDTMSRSPEGRTATSNLSLATSIPTMTASIRSHPCASGLALRPKRLFGFDGTADEDPRFSTGLLSLRGLGPSSATALLSPAVLFKLQGGVPSKSEKPTGTQNQDFFSPIRAGTPG